MPRGQTCGGAHESLRAIAGSSPPGGRLGARGLNAEQHSITPADNARPAAPRGGCAQSCEDLPGASACVRTQLELRLGAHAMSRRIQARFHRTPHLRHHSRMPAPPAHHHQHCHDGQ
jgi:hypothetical protein